MNVLIRIGGRYTECSIGNKESIILKLLNLVELILKAIILNEEMKIKNVTVISEIVKKLLF